MEKHLKIIASETKEAKTGRIYKRYKTSEGWMSCFEKETCDYLDNHIGDMVPVEVQETDQGFKNIRGIVRQKEYEEANKEYNATMKPKVNDNNYTTMYVSYAKDIFCALWNSTEKGTLTVEDVMKSSINLVKQAREAFS